MLLLVFGQHRQSDGHSTVIWQLFWPLTRSFAFSLLWKRKSAVAVATHSTHTHTHVYKQMGAGCLVTADRGEIPPFSRSTARFAPVPIEIFFSLVSTAPFFNAI
jgi:hypothetical protein